MTELTEPTYWVRIYASGPIEAAKQAIREDCLREGLCVTIEPTTFIYTGGEEEGFCVGLIQYPRFPSPESDIWQRAVGLAKKIRTATFQHSTLIMDATQTLWLSERDGNK